MQVYLEQFQTAVNVIKHCGGSVGKQPRIAEMVASEEKMDIKKVKKADLEVIKTDAQRRYLAVTFCSAPTEADSAS